MTKTERLMKAFENEKVDRVPVGFWFHLPEDMELDQECVDAHIDYFHRCNVDMVKIMCIHTDRKSTRLNSSHN